MVFVQVVAPTIDLVLVGFDTEPEVCASLCHPFICVLGWYRVPIQTHECAPIVAHRAAHNQEVLVAFDRLDGQAPHHGR